jgi:hypothetical protein
MDASKQERIFNAAKSLGPETFNRLVNSVPDARKRDRLRFWQEEVLVKIAACTGEATLSRDDFLAAFKGEKPLPIELPPLSHEDFLKDPLNFYWTRRADIAPEWITKAWDANAAFREGITYVFMHEVSKNGDLKPEIPHLRFLKKVLNSDQCIALYRAIRTHSPHRESEFRPAFEQVFGRRMVGFPAPLAGHEVIGELGEEAAKKLGVSKDDSYLE